MPRIVRTSTLHVAPQQPDTELPEGDATDAFDPPADADANAPTTATTAPPATEAAPVRRRGRPPRVVTAAPALAPAPAQPAPTAPASMPQLTADTLQGLGLLYVLARSMGVTPDQAADTLRAALRAHDELTGSV